MAGKAKEKQSSKAGSYILADGLVNGYPHWLKTDGSQAIWFEKVSSSWAVAPKSLLGKNFAGISGPDGKDDYPQEIESGWQYGKDDTHLDAGPNDVIFKAIGTFFQTFT